MECSLCRLLQILKNIQIVIELSSKNDFSLLENYESKFIAKFYMIKELESCCEKYLTTGLNPTKCLMILDKCLMFDINTKLLNDCQNYMKWRINEVIKEWESLNVSQNCLLFLLERFQLFNEIDPQNVRGMDLFNFV